jgi:hypothetical protein
MEATKVNASDKANEYFRFKWPWQTVVDGVNKGIDKASSSIKNTVKAKGDDNLTAKNN